jgi:hypothetical protein
VLLTIPDDAVELDVPGPTEELVEEDTSKALDDSCEEDASALLDCPAAEEELEITVTELGGALLDGPADDEVETTVEELGGALLEPPPDVELETTVAELETPCDVEGREDVERLDVEGAALVPLLARLTAALELRTST